MELAPKRAGFAPERLNRISDHLNRNYIEPGKIAGCQTLVARHGHVAYFKSFGQMDRERRKPMADDTIFRLYSMTKPITSVALMIALRAGPLPAQRSGVAIHSRVARAQGVGFGRGREHADRRAGKTDDDAPHT